jgi:acyl carrier protein
MRHPAAASFCRQPAKASLPAMESVCMGSAGYKSRLVGMSAIMETGISDEDILLRLKDVLHETFEIDPARVQPDTHLFTDLELDSIDAVDLAIQVQDMTGMRIKPEDFKNVRTVGDVVAQVRMLLTR